MLFLSPDYLDRLGLPRDASITDVEASLKAQEARCQVLLKIPRKRADGAARLELINTVRAILAGINKEAELAEIYELPTDDDLEPSLYTPSYTNATNGQTAKLQPETVVRQTIYEAAEIRDEGTLGQVRRAINKWASSIPHHEYLMLGNDITITSAWQRPIYYVQLHWLSEDRSLKEEEAPYQGERLPNVPVAAKDIAVWDIKVPERTTFESAQLEQPITTTRQRLDCPRCQKQGQMWCNTCQSTGAILCAQCSGRYQFNCPSCDGKGTLLDRNNRRIDCNQCRGAGIALCGYCRDGWAQCGSCRGSRKITCSICTGRGEVMRSLSLILNYQATQRTALSLPELPDYFTRRFEAARYQPAATSVLKLEGPAPFKKADLTNIEHKPLKQRLDQLCDVVTVTSTNGKDRLRRYRLEIYQLPAISIEYSFEDKQYDLWIVGEAGEIFCRTSPVQEYDQKLARQATQLLQENDLIGCLEKLSGAFLHTPNSSMGLVVLNNTANRLAREFETGAHQQVIKIAQLAEELLGPDLAINFTKLREKAVRRMRMEYLVASFATGIAALVLEFCWLRLTGEVYAWSVAVISSLLILIAIGAVLTFLLATSLGNRGIRLLTSAGISLVIVIVCSIAGLIMQEDYLSQQKREAIARFGRGDYASAKDAITPLESALWAAPRDFELQLLLGRAYVRATYFEKALAALNLALELSGGDNAEVHNELGLAFLGKNDLKSANEHFRRAIELSAPKIYEDAYRNLGRCYGLVYQNGGTFLMGNPDGKPLEAPAHAVTLPAFYLDRYEVTNKQYQEFISATKRPAPTQWPEGNLVAGSENWPVTGVSLADAREYAKWRGEKERLPYRLPSETEWEFAARGSQNRRFPWGNQPDYALANLRGPEGRLSSVGSYSKSATPDGIEDLLGNAAEWVDSELKPYPNSRATVSGSFWVIRGGAYDNQPAEISATTRQAAAITGGDYHNIGFRCALSVDQIMKK